ncbi:hypothetical protein, partial [Acinetobacter pittii]
MQSLNYRNNDASQHGSSAPANSNMRCDSLKSLM